MIRYDAKIREVGEDFLQYLKQKKVFKQRWVYDQLKKIFQDFLQDRHPTCRPRFENCLAHMSTTPRLLYLIDRAYVLFCESTSGILSTEMQLNLLRTDCEIQKVAAKPFSYSEATDRRLVQVRCGIGISCQTNANVTVEAPYLYRYVRSQKPPCDAIIKVIIENTNDYDVRLVNCKVLHNADDYSIPRSTDVPIKARCRYAVIIQYLPTFGDGETEIWFRFSFTNGKYEYTFNLMRLLAFSSYSSLKEGVPTRANPIRRQQNATDRITVKKQPHTLSTSVWGQNQRQFPRYIKSINSTFQHSRPHQDQFYLQRWTSKFKRLILLEEFQAHEDIKRYNNVLSMTQKQGSRLLNLSLPGLAENRPSVLPGDTVFASVIDEQGCRSLRYQGRVEEVGLTDLGIAFSSMLKFKKQMEFYIEFTLNVFSFVTMKRALEMIIKQPNVLKLLAPKVDPAKEYSVPIKSINSFINDNIAGNTEQRQAVENIVHGSDYSVYVIFGPPGTGKTATMVESVKQTIRTHRKFRVLVASPSNGACDLFTKKLLEGGGDFRIGDILRLQARSRRRSTVKYADVKSVSNYDVRGRVFFPTTQKLMTYRVIVCTTITASRLAKSAIANTHFDRVFIDEAGQATEPETIVALAGVLATEGKVILAGDPKQLGPVIRSSLARVGGLQTSYLERIMRYFPKYQPTAGKDGKQVYDERYITKLLRNYRSHESIIRVSNSKFYDKELQAMASKAITNRFCDWERLPQNDFPVIFAGVQGKDQQELNSPSFFNPCELEVVRKYLALLFEKGVKGEEIGVITPYRKQVEKIRQTCVWNSVKVGSVEEFQGEERDVIIISTVRSNVGYFRHDAKFQLGFLQNPKRFNVAVTRAKSLLIVVGNPRLLRCDETWKAFLQHCLENNAYKNEGIAFTMDDLRKSNDELLNAALEESDTEE